MNIKILLWIAVCYLAACSVQPEINLAAPEMEDPPTEIIAIETGTMKATKTINSTVTKSEIQTQTPNPTILATATDAVVGTDIVTSTYQITAIVSATDMLSETYSETATAVSLKDTQDRSCPEPAPEKPDYLHFFLSNRKWPHPSTDREEHYWLSKPLPGAGRFLYTDWLPYGYDAGDRYLIHTGVDSAGPEGTPVLAVANGTVVVAGDDKQSLYGWRCDWYGHLVVIELEDRWLDQPVYVLYGHVLGISVVVGQHVTQGQKIAEVGFGGAAKLPHLHLEVRVGENSFAATRNPLLWLAPPETRGVIIGRLVDPDGRPWQGVTVAAVGRSEDTETYRTWTYLDDPDHLINPDELFAENFVMADIIPGQYEMYVELQDEIYQVPVTVRGGAMSEVEIITLPYKVAGELP